jgi:hypothetical protein
MNQPEQQAMMQSMIENFFKGLSIDDKKQMCATMMGKLTEGLDMQAMMPKMMMGMMAGGEGGPGKMHEMMAEKMHAGSGQAMPEMMLKTMMPHCIGMMLPSIEADQRGEAAAAILSALVEKGSSGMSDAQKQSFRKSLEDVLQASA